MLTGDLEEFPLRTVLEFLATTSSSGVLELRSIELTAGIALRDGAICVALLDVSGVRGLAARMIRAGAVDLERLRKVVRHHQFDAIAWAAALGHDVDDADAAADVYREHTYEALGWLTRVEGATFSFERSPQLEDWPFDAAAVDAVFTVVDERAERWSELPDAVSDLSLVCSPRPDPEGIDAISLTVEQWRVLALVDGRRSLRDLIELSGIGYLDTCLLLHDLVTNGLVELVEPGAASSLATLLDGLAVEQSVASPFPPARPRPQDAPAVPRGLDGAMRVDAADGTGAVAPDEHVLDDAETESDGTGRVPEHDHDPAAPNGAAREASPDAGAPLDDGDPSDANRTLLDRLIGGRAAAG